MNRREILGGGLALSASALSPLPALRPGQISRPADQADRSVLRRRRGRRGRAPVRGADQAAISAPSWSRTSAAPAAPSAWARSPARSPTAIRSGSCNTSTMVINPAIMPKIPYNAEQGLRADLDPRGVGQRHHREPERAGEEPQGVHRLRQGQPGQALLRLGRRRHHDASRRRAVQAADRHAEDRARSLQGRRPEHHRSRRRRRAVRDHQRDRPAAAAARIRQGPHPGGDVGRSASRARRISRPPSKRACRT